MQNDSEFTKIALKIDEVPILYKFNKSHSLQQNITDICKEFNKNNENNKYGLQFNYTNDGPTLNNKYVTDENVAGIKDGYIISLVLSISNILEWIFVKLHLNHEELEKKLIYLPNLCNDPGVLKEIKARNYDNKIVAMALKLEKDSLFFILKAISNLLSNGIQPRSINAKFIEFLVNIVKEDNNSNTMDLISMSFQLLNQIMNNGYDHRLIILLLKINDITPYFWRKNLLELQFEAIKLINNYVQRAEEPHKSDIIEELKSPNNRKIIYEHLSANAETHQNLAHELCVLQINILNKTYRHLLTEKVSYDTDYSFIEENNSPRESILDFDEKITRIRTNTYNSDSSSDILRLSRSSSIDDQIDGVSIRSKNISIVSSFDSTEISKLAASCIDYYRNKYEKNYVISVLEAKYNPGFNQICDQITNILCEILCINTKLEETSTLYIPLLFGCSDKELFFEELFCRAIWLLAKTRREMRAKVDNDHDKVLAVVKEQLLLALKKQPMVLLNLTKVLKQITYKNVFDKWESERNEKWTNLLQQTPGLQQLKQKLLPDIEELIKTQRLEILKRGETFIKHSDKRGKPQYWFISLTKDRKKIQYGDFDPDTRRYTGDKHFISVNCIHHAVIGKASRLVKENKIRKPELISRCITLLLDEEKSLDFIAINELTAQYWMDGFQLLLGRLASSKNYQSELEVLLTMELNIHLIELQNIVIPKTPPPIPPLPVEYQDKPVIPQKADHLRQSVLNRRTMQKIGNSS